MTLFLFATASTSLAQNEKLEPGDVERARNILSDVNDAIKKNYYDPKFHDVDLQGRYKEAHERLNKAQNFNQMLGIVAWFTDSLNDSHTFFVPPEHAFRIDYGWRAQMVGDKCFVVRVKPGTDAETQKLQPGDQIISIHGLEPNRDNLHKIQYIFNVLRPQPVLRLTIRTPAGEQRTLDIKAMIKPTRQKLRNWDDFMDEIRHYERSTEIYERRNARIGDDVFVWKLHDFMMDEKGSDNMVKDAKQSHGLVIDLRGNPGGSMLAVQRMIGDLLDHDVKVADPVGRKKLPESTVAKTRGYSYPGKLVILIDSESASAAEILARAMQLEKRATIIGDRSAGAVMVAQYFSMHAGLDHTIYYGASVTGWDYIMADGKSLEHTGVTPDEVVLPTAEDLAKGRDPVLAHAIEVAGGKVSPEKAAELFPYRWPPD